MGDSAKFLQDGLAAVNEAVQQDSKVNISNDLFSF
jgi:hypothetical protein